MEKSGRGEGHLSSKYTGLIHGLDMTDDREKDIEVTQVSGLLTK